MEFPLDFDGMEFHRVVLTAQSRCGEKEPQNLRIYCGRPTGDKIQKKKDQNPAEQAAKKVECRGSHAHREKEQFSLRAQNREGSRQRLVNAIYASHFRHVVT
jgi:hypothetical protein